MNAAPLSIGQCATLAAIWEATATKPGNVHRGADFDDATFADFVTSAVAIGPVFDCAATLRLGRLVLTAIQATRSAVGTNTNLGMALLMAPLAIADGKRPLDAEIARVLHALDAQDARDVYAAIRLAQPGGLGEVAQADVMHGVADDLVQAMRLAADRDLVARQYANGFHEVLGFVLPALEQALACGWSLNDAIVRVHVRTMHAFPDTLIARKCGPELAQRSAVQAGRVLAAGEPGDANYQAALADFDFWLRSDHHRRNPGTTADLIAAGLFAALRSGTLQLPVRFYS
ncbi:MAG TPA: triphosphoribosyl-dephospho-CoA synthase [Pirellulales bacterium]|jgi:triphosphoribosyl-dephospho-CoA synthase|nr:triphosphoribosyl-dephospho-CoA synthase [Pirellulales bacterium]